MVDNGLEFGDQVFAFSIGQGTAKHGELHSFAGALDCLVRGAQPFGVADVVRYDVDSASHNANLRSASSKAGIGRDFPEKGATKEPCLHLQQAAVGHPIAEDRVANLLPHTALVGTKEGLAAIGS